MNTLATALALAEPVGAIVGVRALARAVGVKAPVSLRTVLTATDPLRRIVVPALTFTQQNLGLFPLVAPGFFPLYKGAERGKVVPTVAARLQAELPDVVGFSEFWVRGDRNALIAAVGHLYPFHVSGPFEGDPSTIESEVFDGGLLLLSRHPIVATNHTIYRQCEGEDCFTNKGVLHARIKPASSPFAIDVFLSHMQSCPSELGTPEFGPGDCKHKLGVTQVAHLSAFIHAFTDPGRPALLLGDLNHDGLKDSERVSLLAGLGSPLDVWPVAGDGSPGITSDAEGSFQADRGPRPVNDPIRHKSGARLDYALSWPVAHLGRVTPIFERAEIVQWQTSPGRDISDHYGLRCRLHSILEPRVDLNTPINSVKLWVAGFRALRETGGPTGVISETTGSDEIELKIGYTSANGLSEGFNTGTWSTDDGIDTGDYVDVEGFFAVPIPGMPAPRITWGDPGAFIQVEASIAEMDDLSGIYTDSMSLGTRTLRFERADLLRYKGHGLVSRVLPIFRGDGGEYALTIKLIVE